MNETEDQNQKSIKEKPTVMAFGDSLVFGLGSTKGNDFVSILSDRVKNEIKSSIVNLGVSGDTTAEGLERIGTVINKNPDIVIILLGGNDYLRRFPKQITIGNLEKIIRELQKDNIKVILLGMERGFLGENYGRDFKALAEKTEVAYVPDILDDILGNREHMSDAIHPNDKGYKIIADRVQPVLLEVIEEYYK